MKRELTEKDLEMIEMRKEPFCVVLSIPSQPNTLVVTYKNKTNKQVISISEVDDKSNIITNSYFKNRGCSGFCAADIKDIKQIITTVKPLDWEKHNQQYFVESYYEKH